MSSSAMDLLVRHALLLGEVVDGAAVARRFVLDPGEVRELLLDDQARGWVRRRPRVCGSAPGFLAALAHWQFGPMPGEPLDQNQHRDRGWDERVLMQFHILVRAVSPLCVRLEQTLDRFRGYPPRLAEALSRVDRGDTASLDQLSDVSLLAVWFELREDLRTTLQLEAAAHS